MEKVTCGFCLTPFAPGAERLALTDRRRWVGVRAGVGMWSAPLDRVMLDLAQRLGAAPGALTVHQGAGPPGDHADIEIRGPARASGAVEVLALVAHGLTADQARAGLAAAARLLRPSQGRLAQGRAA